MLQVLQKSSPLEARYFAKRGRRGTFFLLCRLALSPPSCLNTLSPPHTHTQTHVRYIQYLLFYYFSDTEYSLSLKTNNNKTATQKIEFWSPCFCFVHAQVTSQITDWKSQPLEQQEKKKTQTTVQIGKTEG